jgi:hypothetical protein
MIADYFMKPLQGELFYKFCDQIMGVVLVDTITGDHRRSVLDEKSNISATLDKPKVVPPRTARPKKAHLKRKTSVPHSWADVVKSKASRGSIGHLMPIIKQ